VNGLTDAAAYYYLKTNGESRSTAQRIRGEFEPKAWINFNGQTLEIRDRYNVASVTRYDTRGAFQINFASPLANTNYVAVGNATRSIGATALDIVGIVLQSTDYLRIVCRQANNDSSDSAIVNIVVFGSNVTGGSNVTQPSGGTGGGTIGWGNLPGNYILP
jgi:hypothetical protein